MRMFQPQVKLEFIRRYCLPARGWEVYADIDASEEGRTGGDRQTDEARSRQRDMQEQGRSARGELKELGVCTNGGRAAWLRQHGLPELEGDRDIVAFNQKGRVYVVAEVEGASSGQPEQKLYRAIGQLVFEASTPVARGWQRRLALVVAGDRLASYLGDARALRRLGIAGLALDEKPRGDRWLFGVPLRRLG